MNKNIIKTIKIDLAGTEVEVTPLQAKELHAALGSLLGLDKPAIKFVERNTVRDPLPGYPWYWPYQTFTQTLNAIEFPEPLKVTYSGSTGSALVKIL